jgi:hypothetical protein
MTQVVVDVTYLTGAQLHFHIDAGRGWRLDPVDRKLVFHAAEGDDQVLHTSVPLDNVAYWDVRRIEDKGTTKTDGAKNTCECGGQVMPPGVSEMKVNGPVHRAVPSGVLGVPVYCDPF